MTYNTSKIMKVAWERYNQHRPTKFSHMRLGACLRVAWQVAKYEPSLKVVKIADRRAQLEQQLFMLSFSDAIGTAAKMRALQEQIHSLPKAA